MVHVSISSTCRFSPAISAGGRTYLQRIFFVLQSIHRSLRSWRRVDNDVWWAQPVLCN